MNCPLSSYEPHWPSDGSQYRPAAQGESREGQGWVGGSRPARPWSPACSQGGRTRVGIKVVAAVGVQKVARSCIVLESGRLRRLPQLLQRSGVRLLRLLRLLLAELPRNLPLLPIGSLLPLPRRQRVLAVVAAAAAKLLGRPARVGQRRLGSRLWRQLPAVLRRLLCKAVPSVRQLQAAPAQLRILAGGQRLSRILHAASARQRHGVRSDAAKSAGRDEARQRHSGGEVWHWSWAR